MNTVRLHGIGCAIATVIIGMTTSGASGAPFLSGNELYTSCTSPADRGECIGYVEGVLDTADFEGLFYKGNSNLRAAVEGSNVEWCPHPGLHPGRQPMSLRNFCVIILRFGMTVPQASSLRR
jgi:hypothetical protein